MSAVQATFFLLGQNSLLSEPAKQGKMGEVHKGNDDARSVIVRHLSPD